tara:strand:+ start:25 stop:225 length:201 start_codon:yes stop_codon:yes gene_type:complete
MKILKLILVFVFFSENSYAYIDPGTGSMIIQAILAIGATIIFYLGYPLRIIKKIILKFKNHKEEKK